MKRTRFFIMIIVLLCVAACHPKKQENEISQEIKNLSEETVRDGYFIHISSGYEAPKKALMALSFANKVKEDHDVLLFFDLEGVKLLGKDSKDLQIEHYTPLKEALTTLCSAGIEIMACPMCLKSAGIEEVNLMQGVILADKDKFFRFTGGRIISLDY